MKAIYSLFIAITVVALLTGCGKTETTKSPDAVPTPMDNLMSLKNAIQAFNTKEGHFPKTLDELVPTYIAKIPDAPAGYKYAYDPATGELKASR